MQPSDIKPLLDSILESLAAVEHERWCHWQSYLHSKCMPVEDGLLIPSELAQRWQAQIEKPYCDLSEKEKESDREQVRAYLRLIEKTLVDSLSTKHL